MCQGGRGFASTKDSADSSIRYQEGYIKKSKESLITATRYNINNPRINRTIITRKHKWEEKQMYGYFKPRINEVSQEKTWTWQRKGNLQRESKSLQKQHHKAQKRSII